MISHWFSFTQKNMSFVKALLCDIWVEQSEINQSLISLFLFLLSLYMPFLKFIPRFPWNPGFQPKSWIPGVKTGAMHITLYGETTTCGGTTSYLKEGVKQGSI